MFRGNDTSYLQLVRKRFRNVIAIMGIGRQSGTNSKMLIIGESLGESIWEFFALFWQFFIKFEVISK